MPRSKCLAPPPTRRPPRPLGTQSGQGTPTLVSVYRSSSPRTLQAREMGPQGGRAGCPETQAGAMRRPLHFCQCLTSWRPTLGYPTAGGYPLCTLTLLMMWGPALGPYLGWPTLGGDVGCFKVTEPTKAPPPRPPILAPSYLALSCPLPAEAMGHHPSRAPRARPHPPAALPGTLVSTKLPKTSPAFEASNPHHLSVCPQGPSRRGTIGTPQRPLFRWGSGQWVDLASPL